MSYDGYVRVFCHLLRYTCCLAFYGLIGQSM